MRREQRVAKLDALRGHITVLSGAADHREIIRKAVTGCDGVLTALARGVRGDSTVTAQAVLDHAPRARAWCPPAGGTSRVTVKRSAHKCK
jgi:hypothetical protein